MSRHLTFAAVGVAAMTAVVLPAFAQTPGTPGNVPVLPRAIAAGKVLHIDRDAGLVKLDSDEGVVVVKPPTQTLRAIRVGDTVSVVRSVEAPSVSPRTTPKP